MEENPCNNIYPLRKNAPAVTVLETNPFPLYKCTDDAGSMHSTRSLVEVKNGWSCTSCVHIPSWHDRDKFIGFCIVLASFLHGGADGNCSLPVSPPCGVTFLSSE